MNADARPAACDVLFATSPKIRLNPRASSPGFFCGLALSPAIALPSFYAKSPKAGAAVRPGELQT
jgi:hypothetical protein